MQSKYKVKAAQIYNAQHQIATAIELRDRATQVALNFVGHSISSSDGSYDLLIDCIYRELIAVADEARAAQAAITAQAERDECVKIVQKTYSEWFNGEEGHGTAEAFRLAVDRIRARGKE